MQSRRGGGRDGRFLDPGHSIYCNPCMRLHGTRTKAICDLCCLYRYVVDAVDNRAFVGSVYVTHDAPSTNFPRQHFFRFMRQPSMNTFLNNHRGPATCCWAHQPGLGKHPSPPSPWVHKSLPSLSPCEENPIRCQAVLGEHSPPLTPLYCLIKIDGGGDTSAGGKPRCPFPA